MPAQDGSAGFVCPNRQFKLHMCTTLQGGDSWTTWSADTFRFFTEINDSPDAWSQINGHYALSCPTVQELQSIRDGATGVTQLECSVMSTLDAPQGGGQVAVYCEGPEYAAMSQADAPPIAATAFPEAPDVDYQHAGEQRQVRVPLSYCTKCN